MEHMEISCLGKVLPILEMITERGNKHREKKKRKREREKDLNITLLGYLCTQIFT